MWHRRPTRAFSSTTCSESASRSSWWPLPRSWRRVTGSLSTRCTARRLAAATLDLESAAAIYVGLHVDDATPASVCACVVVRRGLEPLPPERVPRGWTVSIGGDVLGTNVLLLVQSRITRRRQSAPRRGASGAARPGAAARPARRGGPQSSPQSGIGGILFSSLVAGMSLAHTLRQCTVEVAKTRSTT